MTNKLRILKEYAKEDFLLSLTSKGIYNRALKDIKKIENIKIEEVENKIKVSFYNKNNLDNIEIFFTDNIKDARCNCPSNKICKHIIAALLYIKEYVKSNNIENETSDKNNKNDRNNKNIKDIVKEIEEINKTKAKKNYKKKINIIEEDILDFSKNFIENIFAKGFYSCGEKDFDIAEQIAVKLNDFAELSKSFRSLSKNIDSMINKKAFFNKEFAFNNLSKIYNTIRIIEESNKNKENIELQGVKSEYIEKGDGDFIGLGAYPWVSSSGYSGITSYLYDLNNKKISLYSYAVANFYDNSNNFNFENIIKNYRKKNNWENNISIEEISKYKIKLINYKINNENRISSSKKTSAILDERIDYNFIKSIKDLKIFYSSYDYIKNIDFKYDYFDNKDKIKIIIAEFQKIENIKFDKINQILFFDIVNNNEKLTLNIKYNKINLSGIDYIKNYKNSEIDKNKFMVIEKTKYSIRLISVININAVINIFFES